jgi:salicylate hydroxylase
VAGPGPVVVAGAGIAGLTLALAAARRGVAVRLFERAPTLSESGAGLQLAPNAGRILDALGLGPALDEVSVEPSTLRIRSGRRSGGVIATLPLSQARRRWGAPYRLIRRSGLQNVLQAAATAAGVELVLGQAATGVGFDGDRAVLRLAGGGEAQGAAVIGADGLFSAVRRSLGDSHAPRGSETVAWRAVIAAAATDDILLWLGPGGHVVAYPVAPAPGGAARLNIVACLPGRTAGVSPTPGDAEVLRRALGGWAPEVRAIAATPATWTVWPLLDRTAGHFPGRGTAALIGDAAHPALPHLAQGAAMAIEDAALLAAAVAAAPSDIAMALGRFEHARAPRVARIQAEARANGRVYAMATLPARARNLVLAALGPERLMARYDWLYGWRG